MPGRADLLDAVLVALDSLAAGVEAEASGRRRGIGALEAVEDLPVLVVGNPKSRSRTRATQSSPAIAASTVTGDFLS